MLTFAAKTWGRSGHCTKIGVLFLAGISCAALVLIVIYASDPPVPPPPPAGNEYGAADPPQLRHPLSLPPDEGAWLVVSIIGGGFDGKGMGGVAANSSGKVVVASPSAHQELHFSCESRLADEELHELANVVSSAQGRKWVKRYVDPKNPDGCCDQFSYLLELHRRQPGGGEQVYIVSWYDSSTYLLPKDLTALQEAVNRVKTKGFNNCGSTPGVR